MERSSLIQKINADIDACLSNEDIDFSTLRSLIEKRDSAVKTHLATLDEAKAKVFAQKEIAFQSSLQERISTLLASAKNDLSLSITARKVAAKYK
jgi:hypothetical protein